MKMKVSEGNKQLFRTKFSNKNSKLKIPLISAKSDTSKPSPKEIDPNRNLLLIKFSKTQNSHVRHLSETSALTRELNSENSQNENLISKVTDSSKLRIDTNHSDQNSGREEKKEILRKRQSSQNKGMKSFTEGIFVRNDKKSLTNGFPIKKGQLVLKNDDFEDDNIISIFKKDNEARNPKEILILSKFIEKTEFFEKNKEKVFKNAPSFLAQHLKFEIFKKDNYFFRESEFVDKFFFLLKGSATIIRTKEILVEMNIHKYLILIEKLIRSDKNYILDITLKANKDIFPIEQKDISKIKAVCNKINLRSKIERSNTLIEYKKVMEEYQESQGENLGKNKYENTNKLGIIRKSSIKNISQSLSSIKYYFLDNPEKNYSVKTYENYEDGIIQSGEFLENNTNEIRNNLRKYSIIANEDCQVASIDYFKFTDFLSKTKNENDLQECSNLNKNFFYKSFDSIDFYSKIFSVLEYKEKVKGNNFLSDKEPLNSIYFITEGEVEYTFNGSIMKFIKSIKEICKTSQIQYNYSKYEKEIISKLKNHKDLNCMKQLKIYSSSNEDVVGLEEFFFKINKNLSSKIYSKNLCYYVLQYDKFKKIIEKDQKLEKKFECSANSKLNSLIEKLNAIKNTMIELVKKKFTDFEEKESKPIYKEMTSGILTSSLLNNITTDDKNHLRISYQTEKKKVYTMNKVFDRSKFLNVKLNQDDVNLLNFITPTKKSSNDFFDLTSKNTLKCNVLLNKQFKSDLTQTIRAKTGLSFNFDSEDNKSKNPILINNNTSGGKSSQSGNLLNGNIKGHRRYSSVNDYKFNLND